MSIFGFNYAKYCQDIDSTESLKLRCNDSSTTFYVNRSGQLNELPIIGQTISNNPNPNKYSPGSESGNKTLTIKQFDKYDSGIDTYYTRDTNDAIICTYDILIFSEYSLITISVISI